jgi:hypothetical protein
VTVRCKLWIGRAIAEAVSRWLPTTAARVQSRVWSSGICGGQSGVGAGFLRVLRFPLPFIPSNSPSSQSPEAGTIGQEVADVPSGPSLDSTPHYANVIKNNNNNAWIVFARWNAGIVGSNLTQRMDAYVNLFCICVVLCVGSGLATGLSPVQGVLPSV